MSIVSSKQINQQFLDSQVGDWKKLAQRYKSHYTWSTKRSIMSFFVAVLVCAVFGLILALFPNPTDQKIVIFVAFAMFGFIAGIFVVLMQAINAKRKPMVVAGQVRKITEVKRNGFTINFILRVLVFKAATVNVDGFEEINDKIRGKTLSVLINNLDIINHIRQTPENRIHILFMTGGKSLLALLKNGEVIYDYKKSKK